MKKIYSFLFGAFALTTSFAQTGWTVYSYTTSSNIPNTTFNSIAIDQTGNIWAGTSYSGIVKYNGTSWSKFTQSNSNISHDFTNDILVDNSNKIWVGTYKGVSVYNGTTFTNYDTINASFKGSEVYSLGKDNNGVIWLASKIGSFGYKGLTTYNGTTWTNLTGLPSQVTSTDFNDYAFTSTNEAWIANGNGMLKYNGTFTFYPKATTGLWNSKTITKDATGNIWAGGFDGLLKYSTTGTWTMRDNVADLGLTSNTLFYDILVDGNYLWLATSSGLLKFNMTTGIIEANYKTGNSPLATNGVTSLAKDASGKIWMATTIGIVKMDPTLVIGIEEIKMQGPFKIYPNPSTGIYNFSYDGFTNLDYKIFSATGTLVSEGKAGSSDFQINLKNVANGMYFVHINTENSVNQVIKLIKE